MTWGEFKKMIEDEGIKDDNEICWIDVSGLDGKPKINIKKELDGRTRFEAYN